MDRLAVPLFLESFGALLAQPAVQLGDKRRTGLLAPAQALLRRKSLTSRSMTNRTSIDRLGHYRRIRTARPFPLQLTAMDRFADINGN